jgi:hypothetical protein
MRDPAIKPHLLTKFQSGFPNSASEKLETCGHFPQEELPELVSEKIMTFMSEYSSLQQVHHSSANSDYRLAGNCP